LLARVGQNQATTEGEEMKTMKELVLDRLIEETVRPLRTELEEIRKELTTTKQTLRYREDGLAREAAARQKLQSEASAAETPLTNFYRAAEAVRDAANQPRANLNSAISKLVSAMQKASQYVDQIPF
jgi:capsule polysaccharide export protein KpsE/RkpR